MLPLPGWLFRRLVWMNGWDCDPAQEIVCHIWTSSVKLAWGCGMWTWIVKVEGIITIKKLCKWHFVGDFYFTHTPITALAFICYPASPQNIDIFFGMLSNFERQWQEGTAWSAEKNNFYIVWWFLWNLVYSFSIICNIAFWHKISSIARMWS